MTMTEGSHINSSGGIRIWACMRPSDPSSAYPRPPWASSRPIVALFCLSSPSSCTTADSSSLAVAIGLTSFPRFPFPISIPDEDDRPMTRILQICHQAMHDRWTSRQGREAGRGARPQGDPEGNNATRFSRVSQELVVGPCDGAIRAASLPDLLGRAAMLVRHGDGTLRRRIRPCPGSAWIVGRPVQGWVGLRPLFTLVRGIGILGSSLAGFCIAPVLYSRSSYVQNRKKHYPYLRYGTLALSPRGVMMPGAIAV